MEKSPKLKIGFLTIADSHHVTSRTNYFVRNGHDVYYIGILPGLGNPIDYPGVTYIPVGAGFSHPLLRFPILFWKLRRILASLKLDILHIIDMGCSIYAPFAPAKALVFENNGSDVLVLPNKDWRRRLAYPLLYRWADGVVQDSNVSQQAGIRYGAPTRYNIVVESGVDFNVFHDAIPKGIARQRLGINTDQKFIFSPRGFVGIYNIETIIKTIPAVRSVFPDVRYVFCRHFGHLAGDYETLAASLGVKDHIVFTGFLHNEKEMPFYYRDADLIVSVPFSDSSPRSVYEAMACKTPVVVSDLPWLKNKFEPGRELLVVETTDVDGLASQMLGILDGSRGPDVQLAYEKVHHSINIMKSNAILEDFYYNILERL